MFWRSWNSVTISNMVRIERTTLRRMTARHDARSALNACVMAMRMPICDDSWWEGGVPLMSLGVGNLEGSHAKLELAFPRRSAKRRTFECCRFSLLIMESRISNKTRVRQSKVITRLALTWKEERVIVVCEGTLMGVTYRAEAPL